MKFSSTLLLALLCEVTGKSLRYHEENEKLPRAQSPASHFESVRQYADRALQVSEWTDFVVGDGSVACNDGSLVRGIGCTGGYCDDVRLYCHSVPNSNSLAILSSYTTAIVSEETKPIVCDDNSFMTGISCQGNYCDDLSMVCTHVQGRSVGSCQWSDWVSEEGSGSLTFTDVGYYARGIECRGWYCDDKRFLICEASYSSADKGIAALKLYHATTNTFITDISNGDSIDISEYLSSPFFNIQAYSVGSIVKSVLFSNGRSESVEPFAYCGDNGGEYTACPDLGIGTFTVSAEPTSFDNEALPTISASFTLTRGPTFSPVTTAPTMSPAPTATFMIDGSWIEVDANANINARHEACFVMAGRKAVLIGGRGGRGVDIYDPVTRTWQKGADPPQSEIHHMQCVAVNEKVYIVAAWTGWYPRETNAEHVYVYSHATDKWEEKTALPEARRRGGAAAILVGRNIYVSHGNRGGHEQDGTNAATSLGWLDYYNVDTDTWTIGLPNAPNPRDHTGGALVNGHLICVSGGRNGGIEDWPEIAETDCFDLNTQTWSVEADIPQVRGGSSYGQTCDGQLMIAGGEGGGKAWTNVDVFDGTSWTTIASLNLQRHGSGLAVDCQCGQIHIASGATGQGGGPETTSVETYFFGGLDTACNA